MGNLAATTMWCVGILAKLTPRQRWESLRSGSDAGNGVWAVVLAALGAICVGGAVFAIVRSRRGGGQKWRAFNAHPKLQPLTESQRKLVAAIAASAKLARPELLLTAAGAFDSAAAGYAASNADPATQSLVQAVKAKLGFAASAGSSAEKTAPEGALKVGADVTIIAEGNSNEFAARVVELRGNQAVLDCARDPATPNRRRFARAKVELDARVAPSGVVDKSEAPAAEFAPASVTEISGGGAIVESTLQRDVGQKLLLVIDLEDKTVQAQAVVRWAEDRPDGIVRLGVELMGLSEEETSHLVLATGDAERHSRWREGQPAAAGAEEGK